MVPKASLVQIRNPRTDRYVKINRAEGKIISEKKSPGPYKNVVIVEACKS